MYRDRVVAIVGDAACGVPFFRALNNGLLCGTMLAAAAPAFLLSASEHVSTQQQQQQQQQWQRGSIP